MNESDIRVNSARAWMLAARPKTLTGASVPVIIALALSWGHTGMEGFKPVPAVLCLLFALVMQIDANFINDYFDNKRGNDDETRLGPLRACAQGWVTMRAMLWAIGLTTVAACAIGLPLILYGGWWMVAVGAVCVLFCFLYTTWLSYLGLGDVLVLVFFGIVPVCATFYLQTGSVTMHCVVASVACGLVIDTLLVVNNYRDIDNDRRAGKVTLIVRLGAKRGRQLYFLLGVVACALGVCYIPTGHALAFILPLPYLWFHYIAYREMVIICKGRELNHVLGLTARNMLLYGLLVAAGYVM